MQNPEGGGIANQASDRNNAYRSVVSDLVSLTEHVQASLRLIEQAIAREALLGSQETDVVVLDDVTPPFVKASAALNACDANLAIALHSLLASNAPEYDPGNFGWSQRALPIVSA
jgi:hypothetical protein